MPPRTRKKKTSDVPTRIWSSRVTAPITEPNRVDAQFKLAHQYRNALVEVNQWMWECFREIWIADPRVAPALLRYQDACGDVDDAYDELRAAKSGVAEPDLTAPLERLDAAKELRQIAGEELHAAKESVKQLDRAAELADPVVGPARLKFEEAKKADKASDAGEDDKALRKELQKQLREAWYVAQREAESEGRLPVNAFRLVHDAVKKRQRAARAAFIKRGLRTATYTRIEDAIKQAAATSKGPLHFERYDGTGSIGTQLTATGKAGPEIKGMTVSELLSGQDTRLRLGAPGEADPHPRPEVAGISWPDVAKLGYETWGKKSGRNLRRHAARTYVDLRIGSNPDRSPIFARFPITLHRFPPMDAVIKWAYVVRRRIGYRYEWRFQLTLESKNFRPCTTAVGEGACAIDLGWRRLFDDEGKQIGLRVGYIVDETGHEQEIRAPENLVTGMDKVYGLASTRDKEFEIARAKLVTWLKGRETPAWMADRVDSLAQWRAPRKLQALADAWTGIDWDAWRTARATGKKCNPSDFSSKANRVDGDEAILAVIQTWARQDRHLQNWEEHQRDRLIAHRRETWRVLAAKLSSTYATILIEDGTNTSANREKTMKLPDIPGWERPAPEDGAPSDGREQRRMSRLAAPGELRSEIIKASSKRGARVMVERTADSTRECAWCGSIEEFEAAASLEHTCSSCGRTWDQDANTARNLLHRHGHGSGPVPAVPGAPPIGSAEMSSPVPTAPPTDNMEVPPVQPIDYTEVSEVPAATNDPAPPARLSSLEMPVAPNVPTGQSNSGGTAHAMLSRRK